MHDAPVGILAIPASRGCRSCHARPNRGDDAGKFSEGLSRLTRSARVDRRGATFFTTSRPIPVLTRGHPDSAALVLEPARTVRLATVPLSSLIETAVKYSDGATTFLWRGKSAELTLGAQPPVQCRSS